MEITSISGLSLKASCVVDGHDVCDCGDDIDRVDDVYDETAAADGRATNARVVVASRATRRMSRVELDVMVPVNVLCSSSF